MWLFEDGIPDMCLAALLLCNLSQRSVIQMAGGFNPSNGQRLAWQQDETLGEVVGSASISTFFGRWALLIVERNIA